MYLFFFQTRGPGRFNNLIMIVMMMIIMKILIHLVWDDDGNGGEDDIDQDNAFDVLEFFIKIALVMIKIANMVIGDDESLQSANRKTLLKSWIFFIKITLMMMIKIMNMLIGDDE